MQNFSVSYLPNSVAESVVTKTIPKHFTAMVSSVNQAYKEWITFDASIKMIKDEIKRVGAASVITTINADSTILAALNALFKYTLDTLDDFYDGALINYTNLWGSYISTTPLTSHRFYGFLQHAEDLSETLNSNAEINLTAAANGDYGLNFDQLYGRALTFFNTFM